MNLNKRDQKEILEYLKHITSELTDAYNSTPDTSENSDALYFIDTARDLVDELTINVEDTVTFVNNELPPHNVMFAGHDELSHNDLAFSPGETFEVTFHEAGDYNFQCDPHAGAGMKGVIHVQ